MRIFSLHDFLNMSLFYCIFTCNKYEIRCRVNHSALLHCEYRIGILTVMRGPRHSLNILTRVFSVSYSIALFPYTAGTKKTASLQSYNVFKDWSPFLYIIIKLNKFSLSLFKMSIIHVFSIYICWMMQCLSSFKMYI